MWKSFLQGFSWFLMLGTLSVQAAQAPQLTGELIQGGLVIGKVAAGSRVTHDGNPIRVSPNGDFVIGFHRDAKAHSVLEVTYNDGSKREMPLKIKQREYQIQRIDGLPDRKVTPRKEDLERIRADAAAAKRARSIDEPRTDFLSGFEWPVLGRISGVYGSQRILNGAPRRPHYGVDIARATGTPVRAPADAVVTLAHPDMFYSGATLIMDHGHGLSSTFIHLNRILVAEGQQVRKGQVVAEVGASGRVTGPHLDWRMNLFNKRLDPQTVVGPMPSEGT